MNPDCSLLYWSEPLKGWVCVQRQAKIYADQGTSWMAIDSCPQIPVNIVQTHCCCWIILALIVAGGVILAKMSRKKKHHENNEREEVRLLKEIREGEREILHAIHPTAKSAKGELMPATFAVGSAGAQFVFTEFDGPGGTGNQVPPVGTVAYASDNTSVATVDSTGKVTAVAAGTCNISGTDPGNGLTASDSGSVTQTVGVAVSATGVLTAL